MKLLIQLLLASSRTIEPLRWKGEEKVASGISSEKIDDDGRGEKDEPGQMNLNSSWILIGAEELHNRGQAMVCENVFLCGTRSTKARSENVI